MKPCSIIGLILAPTVATGLALAGCGEIKTIHVTACGDPPVSATGERPPVVAALLPDGSTPVMTSTIARTMAMVTQGSEAMKARLVLSGVGNSLGAPNLMVNTSMVAEGPNALFRKTNLDCKTKLIAKETGALLGNMPPTALDDISAFSTLNDDLKDIPGQPVDVVIAGSALTRTQIADGVFLDLNNPWTLSSPIAAINTLARDGLNFRCDGWRVTWVNGSTTAAGKPVSAETDSQLKAFWRLYFAHCGGELVSYSPQIPQFPVQGGAINAAYVTTIPIPIKRTRTTITATLNSQVLFTVASAVLRPGADDELRQVIPLLDHTSGTIDIAGFTDSTGTNAINIPLSTERAATVAHWLERNVGVPASRIHVHGYGSADPVACNCTTSGRARNRRVTVAIQR